ncbi:MAG TPA: M1 family aminopeptidase [Gemmata sp.]|jgi:aminopeptidase N|nr:M1 family aminopeptidase [Gemmata sp.]
MRPLLLMPILFLLLLAGGMQGGSQPPAPAPAPTSTLTEPLRTAGDHPVDVRNLRLDLKVDLHSKTVDARATLSFTTLRKLDAVTLDADGFEVKKVELVSAKGKTKPAHFTHDSRKLIVDFDPPLAAGSDADLVIDYRVREPKQGLYFFAPSKEDPDVPLTVWSDGEPLKNRAWIPCFDRPSIRQSTELVVTVAEGNEVLSNGKLLSKKSDSAAKTTTFHWRQEEPHPAYLITLVVGPFAIVEDKWRDKPVLYYVPPARKGDALRTFGRTPEMMEVFSRKFGVDYPWYKYAQIVAEQYGGGMENTSATTLGDCLLDERAALDGDADGLISHELGHQWWGDLVTCRDWAHIWLNEGFASYCECIWAEHHQGADEYSLEVWRKARGARSSVDRPVVDRRYTNEDSMFDSRAYPKGAFILHMLRQRLGDEVFFAGLKRYLTDNRLKSVETVDFRRAMEQVSGHDLERFFYDWTERSGHPKLEVNTTYDAEAKRVRVMVKQTQAGEPFRFPLKIRLLTSQSRDASVFEEVIDTKEHTIQIPAANRPLGIEIDPYQGVLAEIKEEKGRDWWAWQLAEGCTAASRVEAAEHFGKSKTKEDRETLIAALTKEKTTGVATEIMGALAGSGGDACRDALLEALKSAEPKQRRAAALSLSRFGKDEKIAAAALALLTKGDPSLGVESAALQIYGKQQRPDAVKVLVPWLEKPSSREVLRTSALQALATSEDVAALDILIAWTKRGKPSQCRPSALSALGRLAKTANLTEEQHDQAVKAIAAALTGESLRIRLSAISALQNIGPGAKSALKSLDEIAANDPVESVAEAAKRAASAIRATMPLPQEVKQLREELDRLKKEQEELRKRLEKYEKMEKKGEK